MLPLPLPVLNGIVLEHSELRALHQNMRIAVHAATARYCLDGPRLLRWPSEERYVLRALKRDRDGCLLASVTVESLTEGWRYVRKVRLVPWEKCDRVLKVEVARENGYRHSE